MKRVSTFSLFNFPTTAAIRLLQICLFVFPIFYFSISSLSSTDQPLDQGSSDQVIYISSGAMMIGGENIHIAKSTTVVADTPNEVEHVVTDPSSNAKRSIISSRKEIQLATIKTEKKIAAAKVNVKFFTFPSGNSDIKQRSDNSFNAVFTPSNSLKKFSASVNFIKLVSEDTSQLKKQKFYTSLSYLQFRRYSSSSLRGPPIV